MNELNNPMFEPLALSKHIDQLQTPFGPRGIYDSVSFCNRCGSCAQVCPTFRLSGRETDSPRGRNQAARLILEGRLKVTDAGLTDSLFSCILCGRCTQICAGKIPTAQHVLEMQRTLKKRKLPFLLQHILTLRGKQPKLFRIIVRTALFLRPLWKILASIPGLNWLKEVDLLLPKKIISLPKKITQKQLTVYEKNIDFIYIPSLEAEFLQPEIATASLKLLNLRGHTALWNNTACGLFDFVYGDLRQSRRLLRGLIRRYRTTENGTLPLVTDSLDVYHFLKLAPQVFAENTQLHQHARQLADCVRFITDFFPENLTIPDDISLPVQLDFGTLFNRESAPIFQSISLFKTLFEQNFVECEYTDFDTPAFGYRFTRMNRNAAMQFERAKNIARNQVKTVFTFSGLCALELDVTLRRFYPAAKARHIVCLIDKNL